jgi:hypothetical protein
MTKLCKDCVHCHGAADYGLLWLPIIGWLVLLVQIISEYSIRFATCTLEHNAPDSSEQFVTGRVNFEMREKFCTVCRQYGECGPEGKNWERK